MPQEPRRGTVSQGCGLGTGRTARASTRSRLAPSLSRHPTGPPIPFHPFLPQNKAPDTRRLGAAFNAGRPSLVGALWLCMRL